MSRVNPRNISSNARMKYLDLLWTSIAKLETREEVKHFFKDLLSESEAIMIARRIEIAKRLMTGDSYSKIANELKVGMDTIGKVQQWLTSGFGGYEKAIKGFEKELNCRSIKRSKSSESELYTFDWLKKKYPFHFLLFNLISKKDKES